MRSASPVRTSRALARSGRIAVAAELERNLHVLDRRERGY